MNEGQPLKHVCFNNSLVVKLKGGRRVHQEDVSMGNVKGKMIYVLKGKARSG